MSRLGIRTAVPALPWQRQQLFEGGACCDRCGTREPRLSFVPGGGRERWLCRTCKTKPKGSMVFS